MIEISNRDQLSDADLERIEFELLLEASDFGVDPLYINWQRLRIVGKMVDEAVNAAVSVDIATDLLDRGLLELNERDWDQWDVPDAVPVPRGRALELATTDAFWNDVPAGKVERTLAATPAGHERLRELRPLMDAEPELAERWMHHWAAAVVETTSRSIAGRGPR